MTLNPGNTGLFDGNWRLSNIYRTQWSAIGEPYNTLSLGIDKPFDLRTGQLGLGIYFVNDQSGSAYLNTSKVYMALSYIRRIDNNHKISFGTQIGYVVKSYKLNNITLPSQFDETSGEFNPNLDNNLEHARENVNYEDVNLGISYRSNLERFSPTAGLAVYHLLRPKESFLRNDDTFLPMRYVAHIGGRLKINEVIFANLNAIGMQQKKAQNSVMGASIHYSMPAGNIIEEMFFGTYTRTSMTNMDAVIFKTGFSIFDFQIGFSYDVNISRLQPATNMRGALEVSILYKDISRTLNQIALPCDRF